MSSKSTSTTTIDVVDEIKKLRLRMEKESEYAYSVGARVVGACKKRFALDLKEIEDLASS